MRMLKELNKKCEDYYKEIVGSFLSCGFIEEHVLWNRIVEKSASYGFREWNTRSRRRSDIFTLTSKDGVFNADFFIHLNQNSLHVNCICTESSGKYTTYTGSYEVHLTTQVMVKKAVK